MVEEKQAPKGTTMNESYVELDDLTPSAKIEMAFWVFLVILFVFVVVAFYAGYNYAVQNGCLV